MALHRARWKGWFANGLLLLASIVLFAAVAEGAARIAFPDWRWYWSQGFLYFDHATGTYAGRKNYRGRLTNVFGEYNVAIHLDGEGFRNPEGAGKATDSLVFFGDSFGFGLGVAYEDIYSSIAARSLGRDFVNYSLPGTDLSDYLLVARAHQDRARGRVVVVAVTIENDMLSYPPPAAIGTHRSMSVRNFAFKIALGDSALLSVIGSVLRRSPAVVALVHRLGFTPSVPSDVGGLEKVESSVAMLAAFQDQIKARRLIIVIVPPRPEFGLQEEYRLFAQKLQEQKFEVVDPGIQPGDFFPKDGHWTPEAHKRVGQLILRKLKSR
ncbi:MAG: hypothetical protein HQ512_11740 [Rhodospirillales bacterium]|nr:hypothetical protein [Rhodospirillales bacterium]